MRVTTVAVTIVVALAVTELVSAINITLVEDVYNQCNSALSASNTKSRFDVKEASIDDIRKAFETGKLDSETLVCLYLQRTVIYDPEIGSILEVNPNLVNIAKLRDAERASAKKRGRTLPKLHGIPILLKDNIDTDTAEGLNTTAGSIFLLGSKTKGDSFVVKQLKAAGAIIYGTAQMTEWANYRSSLFNMPDGWSARGNTTVNPYDASIGPCGSSSGSGAAVAASLVTVALGTDSFGSIICPAQFMRLVGFRPTPGLASRNGVCPIWLDTDTVGPLCRTVDDCAYVLDVIAKKDPTDYFAYRIPDSVNSIVYSDYKYKPKLRIGFINSGYVSYFQTILDAVNGKGDLFEALDASQLAGYDYLPVIEPFWNCGFQLDLEAYFRTRTGLKYGNTLKDLIEFTKVEPAENYPTYDIETFLWGYNQSTLEGKIRGTQFCNDNLVEYRARGLTDPVWGLSLIFDKYNLDVLIYDDIYFGNNQAEYASWPSAVYPVNGDLRGVTGFFPDILDANAIGIVAKPLQEEKIFAALKLLDRVVPASQKRSPPAGLP